MTIEIDIHCYYYQVRLCWMLSSILQQQGDCPDLVINISHAENDGKPTTRDVCGFFRDRGLNIIETIVLQEQVSNRAIARNIQVDRACLEKDVDWMFFTDCDMIYDPMFFADLRQNIRPFAEDLRVISADRTSLKRHYCNNYLTDNPMEYPCVIEKVAHKVSKWNVFYVGGGEKAAGYMQLASIFAIEKMCGSKYSVESKDNYSKCITDRRFRKVFEGINKIKTLPQYHLNHDRNRWHHGDEDLAGKEQR